MSEDSRTQAHAALKQAQRAAKRGDLADAERWSKTAERLAAAAEKLGALPGVAIDDEAEEAALRAEFMARLHKLVEVHEEGALWEAERELYERQCAEALRTGAAPPPILRENPGSLERMERIASGEK